MSKSENGGQLGFCSILALIFITLKLLGHITWTWWWVLSPLWIPLGIALFLLILALVLSIYVDDKK